jgi:hypothetical protein
MKNITLYWQPIVGMGLGALMLVLYYYLRVRRKGECVRWIAQHVFGSEYKITSAESLFNVVTSFLFMIGGVWIIVGIYYLSNA